MRKIYSAMLVLMFSGPASVSSFAQAPRQETVVTAEELAKLRSAVEANPNDIAAHEAYIKASGFSKRNAPEDAIVKQYESWMKKFPASAIVPYQLGHAYADKESPKAKPYLLKAVEIDPNFDKAYFDLWLDAQRWGEFEKGRQYLAKAKAAAPKNPDYAFYYASGFFDTDFEKYKTLSLKVAEDFPNTDRGAQALMLLAYRSQNSKEKQKYYEQLKKDFPPEKNRSSVSYMSGYNDLLLTIAPDKAVALAESMLKIELESYSLKLWKDNLELAKNLDNAINLSKAGKALEALSVLDKVTIPRYSKAKEYILLLKANTLDAAGNTAEAYNNLLRVYAKEPSKKTEKDLVRYGTKLGKSQSAINAEIWNVLDTASRQAPNFTLENYFTKANSSLSDYKGKVVLLTYWFPGCGPCRGEFPHFENVIRKYKNRPDFVYLGINIVPEQDDYVIPFMKSSSYSFIPLKDNDKWQKGPLDNRRAAPVNFLIDQNGKILFSDFNTNESNEENLDIMIHSMLTKTKDE
jgi:thiol-disulfide isomerase/thioredoxin